MAELLSAPAPARSSLAASGQAFELLESKLRAPPGRAGHVARTALIGSLEREPAMAPLIVVSAGAGWGKTTLLAQWASRAERPFAWVSVDEKDNDPIVFLTYVAAALDRVSPLNPRVFQALASPGASLEGTVVPRLGAALATMDEPVVLVLDDLHLLDSTACLDAIAALVRHVPEGGQVALSTRGDFALPLGTLRARGLVVEIGPDELRLDEAEAGQLLRSAGLDLTALEVAELTQHTEGWSAGLYLAALSAKASDAGISGATAFQGDDRFVADYLRSELLLRMPREELLFLTRTAVLERMSGPLCDAVLGESRSGPTLESLARSNDFLVPLDRNGEWYRYHHLFQELLRSELARAEPDLVPLLLARATGWCEVNGQPEAAIGYAEEAGDVEHVARLFEQFAVAAYESGRVATVERWLRWLEMHGALEGNAAVAVLGALLAAFWGRPAESERWADAAERASYEGTLPDGSASIDSWRAHLRAQRCDRGLAGMRADAELALRTLSSWSPLRPGARLLLAVSYWLAGELEQADDLLADVAEDGIALGGVDAVAIALSERATIAIARGAWVEAEELAREGRQVIRKHRMEDYPTSALGFAVAARIALHRGDTAGAEELLIRAQRLRPRLTYALSYFAIQTRLELARAYMTTADAGGAATMLREIDALLRRQPNLGVLRAQAEELRASLKTMRAHAPGASTLTEAELHLMPQLATHLSFREIGERLYLSRHTVKSHAMAIYRKLNVSSRTDAVDRARELGLI